jgi:hypothetical protein
VELVIDGSTALSFVVPTLRSGTYYIDYTFDGFASSYPFDVVGYSARIIEFRLDKGTYASGDTMALEANVETNRDVDGLLRISLYDPQDSLIDEFGIPVAFAAGENVIEAERTFSTDTPGIHSLVYGVYGDLPGSPSVLLASGAEYFDGTAVVDTDGDGIPDASDPDDDNDGFDDSAELFVGTSPLDACSWPPDFDDNHVVDMFDVLNVAGRFGSSQGHSSYSQRFDLDANGSIGMTDVLWVAGLFAQGKPECGS